MDVPRVALDMILRFLHNKDYSSGDSLLGVAIVNIEDTAHCGTINNAGVKRGGGSSHMSNAIVKEELVDDNLNKTHSQNRFMNCLSFLWTFRITSRKESTAGLCYILLFLLILISSVILYVRYQRSYKQVISRR